MYITEFLTESSESELPGGPTVKNPPANAGDMSWSLIWKIPHAAGKLSSWDTTAKAHAP